MGALNIFSFNPPFFLGADFPLFIVFLVCQEVEFMHRLFAKFACRRCVPLTLLGSVAALQCTALRFHANQTYTVPPMPPGLAPIHQKCFQLIHKARVMVFLTGTPQEPRCGFTARITSLLDQMGVPYSYYDINADDEVCEALKEYSQWPTYPQLYVDGQLIGGYDVCKEQVLSGELPRLLKEKGLV